MGCPLSAQGDKLFMVHLSPKVEELSKPLHTLRVPVRSTACLSAPEADRELVQGCSHLAFQPCWALPATHPAFKNTTYMQCYLPFPLGSLTLSMHQTVSDDYSFLVELHTWRCGRRLSRDPRTASRPNLSILKEINPEYSLEELILSLRPPDPKSWLIGKDSDAGKDWRWEEKGTTEDWDGWMASLTRWTWLWANSRRQYRTGRPGMLQSIRSQRVGRDLVTEQQRHKDQTYQCLGHYWWRNNNYYSSQIWWAGGF